MGTRVMLRNKESDRRLWNHRLTVLCGVVFAAPKGCCVQVIQTDMRSLEALPEFLSVGWGMQRRGECSKECNGIRGRISQEGRVMREHKTDRSASRPQRRSWLGQWRGRHSATKLLRECRCSGSLQRRSQCGLFSPNIPFLSAPNRSN